MSADRDLNNFTIAPNKKGPGIIIEHDRPGVVLPRHFNIITRDGPEPTANYLEKQITYEDALALAVFLRETVAEATATADEGEAEGAAPAAAGPAAPPPRPAPDPAFAALAKTLDSSQIARLGLTAYVAKAIAPQLEGFNADDLQDVMGFIIGGPAVPPMAPAGPEGTDD